MACRKERSRRPVASEIKAALIGAGIALVGGTVGAFLQHFLSLRADRIKRERDSQRDEACREQDGQQEEVKRLRDQHTEAETRERDSTERDVERLREVLLQSISSRLAARDLERFLEEVERKRDEDGLRWAERSREALENWLTERLQPANQEPKSQVERPVELSD
jgi:hypothetical protein